MPKFEVNASDDKTEATISVDGITTSANAIQLDGLIKALVAVRSELLPCVPKEPPLGETVTPTVDPQYWTNLDKASGASLLMLRHPGLGWLSFLLPPGERDRIVGYFTEQAKEPRVDSDGALSRVH